MAFLLEASFLLSGSSYLLAVLLIAAASLFHVGIFLASGILFWEWVVSNALLVWLLSVLDPVVAQRAFGPDVLLCALLLMLGFWYMGSFWRPWPLGWWDTPFTQRVHWEVVGRSGAVYGLYNDFMCPRERLYGRVHGYFLTNERVCTYHLGEVWSCQLRDAIRESRGDRATLQQIKRRWGRRQRDQDDSVGEREYLRRLFGAINAGRRKHVYPRRLLWLKAPGGSIYYWGRRPGFRGQEPVSSVRILYREEFFDGQQYLTITEENLLEIEVSPDERSQGTAGSQT